MTQALEQKYTQPSLSKKQKGVLDEYEREAKRRKAAAALLPKSASTAGSAAADGASVTTPIPTPVPSAAMVRFEETQPIRACCFRCGSPDHLKYHAPRKTITRVDIRVSTMRSWECSKHPRSFKVTVGPICITGTDGRRAGQHVFRDHSRLRATNKYISFRRPSP